LGLVPWIFAFFRRGRLLLHRLVTFFRRRRDWGLPLPLLAISLSSRVLWLPLLATSRQSRLTRTSTEVVAHHGTGETNNRRQNGLCPIQHSLESPRGDSFGRGLHSRRNLIRCGPGRGDNSHLLRCEPVEKGEWQEHDRSEQQQETCRNG